MSPKRVLGYLLGSFAMAGGILLFSYPFLGARTDNPARFLSLGVVAFLAGIGWVIESSKEEP
jgi:hypothetical protein